MKDARLAKEYLSRLLWIDKRVEDKYLQIEQLRTMAEKTTQILSDMPRNPSAPTSKMEILVVRMVEMENELAQDIESLLTLKKDATARIEALEDMDLQTVLEMRYLSGMAWAKIEDELSYSKRNVQYMHEEALAKLDIPESLH